MAELRKLGDKLNLNLQLYDGTASLPRRVFCNLVRMDGTLVTPQFELTHVGEGEFTETTKVMTSDSILLAHYYVKLTDGVTLDTNYTVSKDVYVRDVNGEIIAGGMSSTSVTVLSGMVEGEVLSTETIEGTLIDDIVEGNIIEGSVIEGVITDEDS